MFDYVKKIVFLFIVLLAAFVLFFNTKSKTPQPKSPEKYVLKSYKNTVALYKNDEIIEVYSSIVLNTLPQKDIQNFNKGIVVSNQFEAELLLEDYDS